MTVELVTYWPGKDATRRTVTLDADGLAAELAWRVELGASKVTVRAVGSDDVFVAVGR